MDNGLLWSIKNHLIKQLSCQRIFIGVPPGSILPCISLEILNLRPFNAFLGKGWAKISLQVMVDLVPTLENMRLLHGVIPNLEGVQIKLQENQQATLKFLEQFYPKSDFKKGCKLIECHFESLIY